MFTWCLAHATAMLSALQTLTHTSLLTNLEGSYHYCPLSQMSELRPTEVKQCVLGHTASKWQNRNLKPKRAFPVNLMVY